MFLIIDKEYRVYKSEVLSGRIAALALKGDVTVISTKKMKGLNSWDYFLEHGEEWSDVQDFPTEFLSNGNKPAEESE